MTQDEGDDDRLLGDSKLFPALLVIVAFVLSLPILLVIAMVMHR